MLLSTDRENEIADGHPANSLISSVHAQLVSTKVNTVSQTPHDTPYHTSSSTPTKTKLPYVRPLIHSMTHPLTHLHPLSHSRSHIHAHYLTTPSLTHPLSPYPVLPCHLSRAWLLPDCVRKRPRAKLRRLLEQTARAGATGKCTCTHPYTDVVCVSLLMPARMRT